MNGKRWLICADGVWPSEQVWQPLKQRSDVIIACDGAFHQCLERGFEPNVVIGDMDSVAEKAMKKTQETIEWLSVKNQDSNDLAKAIDHARQHDALQIDIIGVEGGSVGHQIAPYFALVDAPQNTTIYSAGARIMCVKDSAIELHSIEKGSQVSLFAFGAADGVTLTGCEWVLENETLTTGTRGLNNKSLAAKIKLVVEQGAVLLCVEPDQSGPFGR